MPIPQPVDGRKWCDLHGILLPSGPGVMSRGELLKRKGPSRRHPPPRRYKAESFPGARFRALPPVQISSGLEGKTCHGLEQGKQGFLKAAFTLTCCAGPLFTDFLRCARVHAQCGHGDQNEPHTEDLYADQVFM